MMTSVISAGSSFQNSWEIVIMVPLTQHMNRRFLWPGAMSPVVAGNVPTPSSTSILRGLVHGSWANLLSHSSLEKLDGRTGKEVSSFLWALMIDESTSWQLQVPLWSLFCLLDNRWPHLSPCMPFLLYYRSDDRVEWPPSFTWRKHDFPGNAHCIAEGWPRGHPGKLPHSACMHHHIEDNKRPQLDHLPMTRCLWPRSRKSSFSSFACGLQPPPNIHFM